MSSIRLRLLKWLIVPILLINLAGGVLAYRLAALPPPPAATTAQAGTVDDREAAQRRSAQWRAAVLRALLLMGGAFALASIGLLWFSVSNGLRPLQRLRSDLAVRDADALAPLDADRVPLELAPVVTAFNGLLDKVGEGARARQDFLANVAHQLRTPLAGLKTQLEWLAVRHGAEPDTARSVQLMQAATERMIRQTNQLLALARAEPHHFEKARLETLSLDQLVQQAVQHFVEQAARKAIDIGFHLDPVTVRGDRHLLRDLIDNLVDNALRYTPPGGAVTVRCGAGNMDANADNDVDSAADSDADTAADKSVVSSADGGRAASAAVTAVTGAAAGSWLVVEDNGPGIPAARRAHVFSRYVRLDDNSHGSGLGLAIVRNIAIVHGATVSVGEGPGGAGAAFCVQFPPVC